MTVFDPTFFEEALAEGGGGRYLNLSKIEGEIRVRTVGHGITGWQAWTTDNKPKRWEVKPAQVPEDIKPDMNGSREPKRFFASLVWDYEEEDFKIMEVTQISLIKALGKYLADEDYGDPSGYDLKISREKKGDKTTYTLLAAPPKPLKASIEKALEDVECNLFALYEGADPWSTPVA